MSAIAPKVFVSYSHSDKSWLNSIKQILAPAIQRRLLILWDDSLLRSGCDWRRELVEALKSADVFLFLVSIESLASEPCRKEQEFAEAKYKEFNIPITWIPVSCCLYDIAGFGKFQALCSPKTPLNQLGETDREQALLKACRKLLEVCEQIREESSPGECELSRETRDFAGKKLKH